MASGENDVMTLASTSRETLDALVGGALPPQGCWSGAVRLGAKRSRQATLGGRYASSFSVTASRNGIIARSSAPTFSIGCACSRRRCARNHGRPAASSAIHLRA